jgi:hypothetical protein
MIYNHKQYDLGFTWRIVDKITKLIRGADKNDTN